MKYLYYRMCRFFRTSPFNDSPDFNATIIFSVLIGLNIRTIELLVNHYFNIKIPLYNKEQVILYSSLFGIVLIAINFIFLYQNIKIINEKYSKESKSKKRIGNVVLLTYVIATFYLAVHFGSMYPIR